MEKDYFYEIALSLAPNIGPITANLLIQHCGSAEEVFQTVHPKLKRIQGIRSNTFKGLKDPDIFRRAEKELKFITENRIQVISITDSLYPVRLKTCHDAPFILYFKGNANLGAKKVIAIVGTRHATEYGKVLTHQLIDELKMYNPLIVSGLAYGIDIAAHKAAMEEGLQTIAVLGHGLDRIYPSLHTSVAKRMVEQGGLLSEFTSCIKPDRENFPVRNRIIAGLCEAIVLVEAGINGGALITADMAFSYNREVFAFPGRINDEASKGCNRLIASNTAQIILSGKDISKHLAWDQTAHRIVQRKLMIELSEEEQKVITVLSGYDKITIDLLADKLKIPGPRLSALLLGMEMNGLIKALPGKQYSVL